MINIYKLKFTILQHEILRFLAFSAGKSFNARGLALALNVSQPAIQKALPPLEKKELIKIEKDRLSKRFSICLNLDRRELVDFKRVENLRNLYESGLVYFLTDIFPSSTLVLFGSYAFGEDTENSDIDIAVIGEKEKEANLEKFHKILNRKIFLHFYDNLRNINKNLMENIVNGILLKGGIEL